MTYLLENYRDFPRPDESPFGLENKRFVYQIAKAGAEIETGTEEAEPTAPETIEERDPRKIWDMDIEPEWSVEAFKVKIEASVKEDMDHRERFIQDSVGRYKILYEDIKRKFFADAKNLDSNRKAAIRRAEGEFKSRKTPLKDAVKYDLETKDTKKSISAHVDALNDKYLNYEWSAKNLRGINEREPWNKYFKGILIFYPFIEKNKAIKKYEELAGEFQKNMKAKVLTEFNYLKQQKDVTPEMLKTFRNGIESEYKKFANLDNRSGMIDLRDLLWLEHYSSGNPDILEKLTTDKDESAFRLMEATQLMNAESWENGMDDMKKALMRDVEFGGAEGQFINAANAYRGEEAEAFKTFKEAENYFETTLAVYVKSDVRKTLEFIKHFNGYINKNRVEFISTIDPPSIQGMVYRERKRLLKGRYADLGEYDKILVKFVASNREGRERMINDENKCPKLFKAIQNVQVRYTERYEDEYQEGIPEEIGELRTRDKDRDKPTHHDEAARLLAFISLSNEAEGIIQNFSGNEKYKGLHEDLKGVEADEHVKLALKFKDLRKPKFMPYRSSIFRGGFNGRDLGVKIFKVAGAVTVIANIANSIRQGFELAEGAEGEEADFFDKMAKSIEFSIMNPAVAAGAAVAVGGQLLENHPQYYSYLKADELGRYKISTTASLERLSNKVGEKRLRAFVSNKAEWQAMQKLDKDQIQELMTKAEERANEFDPPRVPGIVAADLEEAIADKTITTQLTKGNGDLRYIFFSKYLTSEDVNVAQLNEACKGWT
jgi:hypothetical protein